jgi:hypothetical protein
MLESNQIINHCVRRTSCDTSRVAFEIANPIDKQATLEVWRVRHVGKTFVSTPEGLILNSEIRRRTVVVAIVGIGDLVVLRAKNPFENAPQFLCYRIGAGFAPSLEDPANGLRETVVIASPIDLIVVGDEPPIRFPQRELQRFFGARNPRWLQELIGEQLSTWKERVPELFIRFAPKAMLDHELPLLVFHAPQLAIAFYKEQLTSDQLESCIRANPDAALHHAFEEMPQKLRFQSLARHPSFGLQRLLFRLSEAELRLCAKHAPSTAFPMRASLSGNRHAIILAASFPEAALESNIGCSSASLRREVVVSLLRYPEEWLLAHNQSLPWLFKNLSTWLDLYLKPAELQRLARRLTPAHRIDLFQYIAERI